MIAAGCKPGEVFGVDCAVIQSSGAFQRPLDWGRVTYEFQDPTYPEHRGIDLGQSGQGGGTVMAAGSGKVLNAGWHHELGNYVMIVHNYKGKQLVTTYAHMQNGSLSVSSGQSVSSGTALGKVGTTGLSFGNHLHFVFQEGVGGQRVNPRRYVSFPPKLVSWNGR